MNEGNKLANSKSYDDDIEENVRQTAAPRAPQVFSQSNLDEDIQDEEIKSGGYLPQKSNTSDV